MWGFLLFLELPHFLTSLGISLFLYRLFRNRWVVLASFLTGFFIDADHLFDYWFFTDWKGGLFDILNTNYFGLSQKVHVLWHAWEGLPLLWLAGIFLNRRFKQKGLQWGMTLAYAGHLLIDQFSGYTTNPLAYFLTYRYLIGFDLARYAR